MSDMTITRKINADRNRVFEIATDLEKWPDQISGITKVEKLTEGPVGVGTRFSETRIMFGREATETMAFTEFESPSRYVVEAENHGCHYRSVFSFSEEDGGTELVMTFHAQPLTFFARLMSLLTKPLMAKSMTKIMEKDLDDIKAAAEQSAE